MPPRRNRGKAVSGSDPLNACLDANGTYVCTAFNPRCFIIQKVVPSTSAPEASVDGDTVNEGASNHEQLPAETYQHPAQSYQHPAQSYQHPAQSYQHPAQSYQHPAENYQHVWNNYQPYQPNPWLSYFPFTGYTYMNGDLGKLSSGAVYNTTPESGTAMGTFSDYTAINGVAEGAEGTSAYPPSAPQDAASQSAYPLPQLKQMLSQQLDYYFSRDNLANDTYLMSQMDDDQYVPIWTIANFNQVKKLTKDIKLITEVLRESPNVQVDEEGVKVRPNHRRCVVILREIPDDTPIEDVKNIFCGENCPRLMACEFAHNSSWYVTFESDDDAQSAYKYLREEVKEFQGKPIMARIKAKTVNRLVIPPVTGVKNGFRVTPPPTAVYDPAAYPPGQQRFVYANGTPGQPVPAFNPVIYPYQQQFYTSVAWPSTSAPNYFDLNSVFHVNGLSPQSFKHPPYRSNQNRPRRQSRGAMHTGSDQSSQGSSQGGSGSSGGQGSSRPPTSHQGIRSNSPQSANNKSTSSKTPLEGAIPKTSHVHNVNDSHDVLVASNSAPIAQPNMHPETPDMYRYGQAPPAMKEAIAPRHRRKKRDDDNVTNGQPRDPANSRGAQFDLVEEAFPPLPGLDASSPSTSKQTAVANAVAETSQSSQMLPEPQQQGLWGENRLSDVVKGTAKSKGGSGSSKGSISGGDNDSPRAVSPQAFPSCSQTMRQTSTDVSELKDASTESGDIALSSVTLTPPITPNSPEKAVQPAPIKCTMADKSTKTDDVLLNGDLDLPCPTTTNAATMTTVVPTEAPSRSGAIVTATAGTKNHVQVHKQNSRSEASKNVSVSPPPIQEYCGNPPRMSYAQVAQHHKEANAQKEKQAAKDKQTEVTPASVPQTKATPPVTNYANSSTNTGRAQTERDNRDFRDNGPQRVDLGGNQQRYNGVNRGGSRPSYDRSQRRRTDTRTSQLRDFVTPRVPK